MVEKEKDSFNESHEERVGRLEQARGKFENQRLSLMTNQFKVRRNPNLVIPRVETGFKMLDEELGGGLPLASITGLSAAPSVGKSTFALQMAEQMAKKNYSVLYFSFEMSTIQVASKTEARNVFLKYDKDQDKSVMAIEMINSQRWDRVTDEQWEVSEQVATEIEEMNTHLFFIDCTLNPMSIDKISQTVQDWIDVYKLCPVVMIDYLHMIAPPVQEGGKTFMSTDKQLLDYNMRGIRKIASTHKTPILFISALKKDDFKSLADMASLSGSSGIPYNCDIILALQYSKISDTDTDAKFDLEEEQRRSPRKVEVVITKNRYFVVGSKVSFDYYSKFDCFDDRDDWRTKSSVVVEPRSGSVSQSEEGSIDEGGF